jgi:hypothetical protein
MAPVPEMVKTLSVSEYDHESGPLVPLCALKKGKDKRRTAINSSVCFII